MRRDIHYAGNYNSSFTIADTSDQKSLARQAAAELGISKDEVPTDEIINFISNCKNKRYFPEDALFEANESRPAEKILAEIYERYQQILELQNTLDFDDMLLLTLKIFENHPDILENYRKTYRYLLVDEYQDTNLTQFMILQKLAGPRPNLCVVGDDDQSIYAWRGADVRNILKFPDYFPGTLIIKLEQNYRSTQKILEAANAVIAGNARRYSKNLWSAKGDGENIHIFQLRNGEEEARFVADAINDLLDKNPDMCYSDCAILYRSNHLSRQFEQEFRKRGIRPKIIGGQEFFQRKEVKDAAAYLKLLLNERDDQSLLRIIGLPPRGIGDKAVIALRNLQQSHTKPLARLLLDNTYHQKITSQARSSAEKLGNTICQFREQFKEPGSLALKAQMYLDEVGYLNGLQRIYKDIREADSRRENVLEFLNYMGQFERSQEGPVTLEDFLENYALMDDNDRTEEEDEKRDAPILSTVHAAKGLEFPAVFIVGMEQNTFPHERALLENAEDEERRLFYVAITRAKEYLFMTYSLERFKFREYVRQLPSKFLKDIPDEIADKPNIDSYFPEASDEDKLAAFAKIMEQLNSF